jgi:hypothetical protein
LTINGIGSDVGADCMDAIADGSSADGDSWNPSVLIRAIRGSPMCVTL